MKCWKHLTVCRVCEIIRATLGYTYQQLSTDSLTVLGASSQGYATYAYSYSSSESSSLPRMLPVSPLALLAFPLLCQLPASSPHYPTAAAAQPTTLPIKNLLLLAHHHHHHGPQAEDGLGPQWACPLLHVWGQHALRDQGVRRFSRCENSYETVDSRITLTPLETLWLI